MMFADPDANLHGVCQEQISHASPGKTYALEFIRVFRLSEDLVTLVNLAGIEIANACLRAISDVRQSDHDLPPSLSLPIELDSIVNAASNVASMGMGAPVRDHTQVVSTAVHLDLGPDCRVQLPYRALAPLLPRTEGEYDEPDEEPDWDAARQMLRLDA